MAPPTDVSLAGHDMHDGFAARTWGVAEDGTAVEIVVPGPVRHLLLERWPPMGLDPSDDPPHSVDKHVLLIIDFVSGHHDLRVDGLQTNGTWERIESELALFAAEHLAGLVAVHAAVIVRDGQAILVPGRSGVGKSTLCVAAGEAGAQVLSDEYALVDPSTGLVTGWRRPVRVRLEGGGVDRRDITVASEPVPVALVAVIAFDGSGDPAMGPITPAEAAIELMNNTVCARSRPDMSLDAVLAVARGARSVSGTRAEAAVAISELFGLLGS